MDPPAHAAVLLETMETLPATTAHAVETRSRSARGVSGLAQSERMLAHEHEQYCDKCEALAVQAALTNEWMDKQGVPNLQASWIAYHYPE